MTSYDGLIWPVIDGYYLEKASITTDDIHIVQDDDKNIFRDCLATSKDIFS
jgi:hypothetical protein